MSGKDNPKPDQPADSGGLAEKCKKLGCSFEDGGILKCNDRDIEEIDIPYGITKIGDRAFSQCRDLRRVTIPDTVTSIGYCAFGECRDLEEIEIPDSVTEMDCAVFHECYKLRRVKLPSGIVTINSSMFDECKALTDIEIQEGVITIWGEAFHECASLTEIALPDSVELVGEFAFIGCRSLKTVYIPDRDVLIGPMAFPEETTVIRRPLGTSSKENGSTQGDGRARREAEERRKIDAVSPLLKENVRISDEALVMLHKKNRIKGLFARRRRSRIQRELDELGNRYRKNRADIGKLL